MSNWQLPGSDLRDDSVQAQKLDRTDTYDFATAGGTVRVQAPAAGTDVANKTYVDALITQYPPVEVVETGVNITIDGTGALPTIDGYAVQNNDRVLLTAQGNAVENGIWIAHAIGTAWERPADFQAGDHAAGRSVLTKAGTYWRDLEMTCTTNPPNDVIGTDALAFAQEGIRIPAGSLTVGTTDVQRGIVYCRGHATGQAEGGNIVLYTSVDHYATIGTFTMRAYEDDLQFLAGASAKLTYKGGEALWFMDAKLGIGTVSVPHGGIGGGIVAIEGANAQAATGPHVQFTTATDDYPLLQIWPWQHDNVGLMFDSYYDGATKSSDAGSNFMIQKTADTLRFRAEAGIAAGGAVTFVTSFEIEADAELLFSPLAALKFYVRDANIWFGSIDDGHFDFSADLSIDLNAHVFLADTAGKNTVVGNQAALATNATDGFLYIPTCAGVPTGVPTAYAGKVAVVFDTTNDDFYIYNGGWKYVEVP